MESKDAAMMLLQGISQALNTRPNGWIRVEDELPKYGSYVIVYDELSHMVRSAVYRDGAFYEEGECEYFEYRVRWWMPLPEPPKEVSGDE